MAAAATFEPGHVDMVHDVQFDYYGRRLATCSSDRTIKVFELAGEHRAQIADLRGHEGPVWQVSWAHPRYGSLLASCSFDHRVIVWKEGPDGQWLQVGYAASMPAGDRGPCRPRRHCRAAVRRRGARCCCRPTAAPGAHGVMGTASHADRAPPCTPPPPLGPQVYKTPSTLHTASINGVAWAPQELGLMFATASSDGSVAVVEHQGDGSWVATTVRRLAPCTAARDGRGRGGRPLIAGAPPRAAARGRAPTGARRPAEGRAPSAGGRGP
jgi:WD40 repeat protein